MLDSATPAPPLLLWGALVLGLIVGSFANVCIHRLPIGHSVVWLPSHCPSCRTPIRPWENVPILSYLVLLGRCRSCRAAISPRYPLVEAANGIAYLALVALFGPSTRALVTMAFVTALIVLSVIDLQHRLLPDAVTIPGTVFFFLASLLPGSPVGWLDSALAAAGGYLGFWAVAALWRRLRRVDALGQGDWKMAAMLGAFFGARPLLLTVFAATLLGTLVGVALIVAGRGDLQSKLPFGTFLGAAGIAVVFAGAPVLAWYRDFFERGGFLA
jgi:leader peptidase (prepilin peptidase)/N-methyltransferase